MTSSGTPQKSLFCSHIGRRILHVGDKELRFQQNCSRAFGRFGRLDDGAQAVGNRRASFIRGANSLLQNSFCAQAMRRRRQAPAAWPRQAGALPKPDAAWRLSASVDTVETRYRGTAYPATSRRGDGESRENASPHGNRAGCRLSISPHRGSLSTMTLACGVDRTSWKSRRRPISPPCSGCGRATRARLQRPRRASFWRASTARESAWL